MRMLTALLSAASLALLPVAQAGLASETDPGPEQVIIADTIADTVETPPGAEQDYAPNPAIWKLADEDTTIYMFGTIHILPPGFEWRSERFNRIVKDVDQLVLETSDDDSAGDVAAMVPLMMKSMFTRKPTSKQLSPSNGKKWLKIGRMTGVSPAEFDRMPLIVSMLGVGLSMSMQDGSKSEYGVETVLSAEFAEMGKPIGSIEDSGEVLAALFGIDETLVLESLEQQLDAWDGKALDTLLLEPSAITEESTGEGAAYTPFAMEHAWARGEVKEDPMFDDSPFGMAMTKVLLEDRNRAWAQWLDDRLDQPGTILLAVGAGHFEGEHSVLLMLQQRGLSAERIN